MKTRTGYVARMLVLAMACCIGTVGAQTQGVTPKEILLGVVEDLSGPAAAMGVSGRQGLDVAVDAINEQGGIHGRKIRLLVEDSGFDVKRGVLATQKLMTNDKVFAFVGNLGSAIVSATMPMVIERGVPMLFPGAGGSDMVFNPPRRLAFATAAPYTIAMPDITAYAHDVLGKRKFCILYQDDDSGIGVLNGVLAGLKNYNLPLVQTSYKRGEIDFSSQFAKMRQADCDVVMLGTIVREAAAAAIERAKIGWNVPMMAAQGALSDAVIKLAGGTAEGMYSISQYIPPSLIRDKPQVAEVIRRYRAKYGVDADPDTSFTYGYTVMMLFAEGARNAGPNLNVDTLVAGLEQLNKFDVGVGAMPPVSFSKTDRLGFRNNHIMQVKNGKWTVIREAK